MRALAATALLWAVGTAQAQAVVNGHEAAASDYPYAVALLDADRVSSDGAFQAQFCGGALTTPTTVVTAAHCLVDQKSRLKVTADELVVAIGHSLKSPGLRTVRVSSLVVHPEYNIDSAENDVAVVMLAEPVTDVPLVTPMRPTDLPAYLETGAKVRVVGWGNQSETGSSYPDHLRVGNLVVFPPSACGSNVPFVLDGVEFDGFDPDEANAQVMVCAAGVTSTGRVIDACQGDSGSPLIGGVDAATRLVGVVSWGEDCATRHPGVYARIAAMTDFLVDQKAIATLAPTAPPQVSIEPLNAALRVTFVPAADGTSASAFAATATDATGNVRSCITTPRRDRLPALCSITGLVNGTEYTVAGISANVLGDSPASAPAVATPLPVPTAGAITSATVKGRSIAVRVAASNGNGTALTSVRVVCTPVGGGAPRSAAVADGRATVSRVAARSHRCATVARNAVGTAASNPRLVTVRD